MSKPRKNMRLILKIAVIIRWRGAAERVCHGAERSASLCQNLRPNRNIPPRTEHRRKTYLAACLSNIAANKPMLRGVSGDPCWYWMSFSNQTRLFCWMWEKMLLLCSRARSHAASEQRRKNPASPIRLMEPAFDLSWLFCKVKKLWLSYYLSSILIT